jgi:hypothetical protein
MKTKLLYFFSFIVFFACTKDMPLEEEKVPTASFTFDKSEYISGQTIHLTNTSTNGDTYLWTKPDGKTDTTFNLDYLISPDDVGGNELFTLTATSAKKTKTSSFSASVIVKPMPASVFSIDGDPSTFNPRPSGVTCSISADNNAWITANVTKGNNPDPFWNTYISINIIYLPIPAGPLTESYSIVSGYSLVMPGKALIKMKIQHGEDFDFYSSLSGVIEISTDNGIVHAVFNHVPTDKGVDLSGDIYGLL